MRPCIHATTLFLLCAGLTACATNTTDTVSDAPLPSGVIDANLASFKKALEVLRDTNWDPAIAAMDVDAVHAAYTPRIKAASSMDDVRRIFAEYFKSIGQSHLNLIPNDLYDDMDSTASEDNEAPQDRQVDDGVTGITLRPIGDSVFVTAVEAGSPAADAGVHPGWKIISVDDKKIRPTIQKMDAALGESSMRTLLIERTISDWLNGPINESVQVRFVEGRKRIDTTLERTTPKGEPFSFGNLPPIDTWIEDRWLEDNTGYIAFNYFMDPMRLAPAFEKAVKDFAEADGIIIDLRGNGGGIAGLAMGFAGWFVSQKNVELGTMHFRDADMRFVVNPRPKGYTGPVAVLVDGCSASCSEILASGLRDLERARVFGQTTAGAALPANFTRLPNGDGFMYPVADYISQGGDRLEGVGVIPDERVPLAPEVLLAGRDPVLEAAMAWIQGQRAPRE